MQSSVKNLQKLQIHISNNSSKNRIITHFAFSLLTTMNNSQQTTNLCDVKYKIVFLGEMMVGKSSIIQKFTHGFIDEKYQNTVGIDFIAKNVTYNNCTYRLQLWDTAGQERFRSLIPGYMKDAHCAVIVYDVNSRVSFQNCKGWFQFYKLHKNSQAITLLVGNKIDLTQKRQVSYQEGVQFAKKFNQTSFCELSAKTGKGLEEMFEKIIENIYIAKKHSEEEKNKKPTQNHSVQIGQKSKSQSRINKRTKIQFPNGKKRQFACCYI